METITIPQNAETIIGTSSKGDQSKSLVGQKWIKENTFGYENMAEYVASIILDSSTLSKNSYVNYTPCLIKKSDGTISEGCYSMDFRGFMQEVTLERLFEANFEATDDVLNNTKYSTKDKFNYIVDRIFYFTNLDVSHSLARIMAFDSFILNEDRHTNNILFLFDPKSENWSLAPLFDHGLSLLSDIKDYPLRTPINILKRKVKAKPFTSSFTKQLDLYVEAPFIKRSQLIEKLDASPYNLGRAKDVVLSQLSEKKLQRIIID